MGNPFPTGPSLNRSLVWRHTTASKLLSENGKTGGEYNKYVSLQLVFINVNCYRVKDWCTILDDISIQKLWQTNGICNRKRPVLKSTLLLTLCSDYNLCGWLILKFTKIFFMSTRTFLINNWRTTILRQETVGEETIGISENNIRGKPYAFYKSYF